MRKSIAGIRARFVKTAAVKYISHINLIHSFERAMRRADIPLEYSKGYHPHPRMSFSPALSVGVTSEAEYLDVILAEMIEPEEFNLRLNVVLPEGLRIEESHYLPQGEPSITSLIAGALYVVTVCVEESISEARVNAGIERLLSCDTLTYHRTRKDAVRQIDLRPLIYDIRCRTLGDSMYTVMEMTLSVGGQGSARPEEIIAMLARKEFVGMDLDIDSIHRKELYTQVSGQLVSPFDRIGEMK